MYQMIIIYWLIDAPQNYCKDGEAMFCDSFVNTVLNSFFKGLNAGGGIADRIDGTGYVFEATS